VVHALLALSLAWLGTGTRDSRPTSVARSSENTPGVIEIEVAPAVLLAPELPAPAAFEQPAVAAPARITPAGPAVSRTAPAPPRAPRVRASMATRPAAPDRAVEPAAVLSMRGGGARHAGEHSAPLAGTDEPVAAVPAGQPWRTADRPGKGPIDLSPAHAARLVAPDPGPPVPSPLQLPGAPAAAPDPRDAWAPTGGGTYRADDLAFTARIGRDGQVTIDDKPSFQITPGRPRFLDEDADDPMGFVRSVGAGTIMLVMNIATFDVTDAVMRAAGMDPYTARKTRFLDQTRDTRAAMRVEATSEDLRNAIVALPRLLEQVWREPGRPAAERRELLFRLWDECTETGSDELVNASRMARATIVAFIRRNLPADSADAYTAAELESLNAARKSTQPFVPYP
jgi:hypothetical protein